MYVYIYILYAYKWVACLELPPIATSWYQAARLQGCTHEWVAQPSDDHCHKDTLLRSWRSGEHSRAPGGLSRQLAGNMRILEIQYLAGENCVVS